MTIGDQLGATPDVKVARIERKKLVVDNKGQFEAITMEEPETTPGRGLPDQQSQLVVERFCIGWTHRLPVGDDIDPGDQDDDQQGDPER